ncbi:MAG: SDR family NAD(P)-dependent oxidoreductase [Actinomycetota bacterium]|nr:SDR family NAD(P)-dependent oxidoreductase [Actinomycetota bacterium]
MDGEAPGVDATAEGRRAAVVTGGASGIGAAVAERLASEGAEVALLDRDEVALRRVVERISTRGERAVAFCVDVTDEETLERAVEDFVGRTGRLDVLVTSAGIQRYGDVLETSRALWDEVLAVNVTGAFLAARACLPELRRARRGAVVLVSSVQGAASQTGVVAYAASKGALGAFARAMALDEARHGVRVNTVSPGSVDTPMLRASAERFGGASGVGELLDSWGRAHPLGRLATPDEVASVVAFLAGDGAAFVTGEDVRVDGGLLAGIPVLLPQPGRPADEPEASR